VLIGKRFADATVVAVCGLIISGRDYVFCSATFYVSVSLKIG
jgi:hypothetical protein